MIEAALNLLRLLGGLAALCCLGAGLMAALLPHPREFRTLERLVLGFGIGVVLLTLWMLALTWRGLPYGLGLILGPPLGLAAALFLTPRGRRNLSGDLRALAWPRRPGLKGWDWLFAGLLVTLFLYAFLRATLYPMWAWDAIATWGCKAKVFYLSRGLDLTCIDAHNYYPNLVPLLLSYLYYCLGQVNDHLAQGLFPLWGALLLGLLFSLARRLGLSRRLALGLTAFLALNGTVFVVHLYIAYADLPLAYFTLGATGLVYLWLAGQAPRGSLLLAAFFLAGMAWCKYEGPPLAATVILAAVLTLLWLRPAGTWRRLCSLSLPLAGLALGYLPWRLFINQEHFNVGADHIQNFYPQQLAQASAYLAGVLIQPFFFGFLWPAAFLAVIALGRRLWTSPALFLLLFLGGNLLAILLAYAVAPTSAAEFPSYLKASMDRLLLHLTPSAALLLGLGLKEWWPATPSEAFNQVEPSRRLHPCP
jgi:hypothetical protein